MKLINGNIIFFPGSPCEKKNKNLPLHHFKREEQKRNNFVLKS